MFILAKWEIDYYKRKLKPYGMHYHVIAKGGVDSHLETVLHHLQSCLPRRVLVMLDFDGVFVSPWHSFRWTMVSVLVFLRLVREDQAKRKAFYQRIKRNIIAFTHIAQQAERAIIWTKRIILPHSKSLFNSLLLWLANKGTEDPHMTRFPFIDHDMRHYLRTQAGVTKDKMLFMGDKSPRTCSDIILALFKKHKLDMLFFVGSGHFDRVVIDTFITTHPEYASHVVFFDTGHWLM